MSEKHASLAHAVLAVMRDVTHLEKEKVTGLNYPITSEASVLGAMRNAFLEHGLVIMPVRAEVTAQSEFTSNKGVPMNRVISRVQYKLLHADSGFESVTVPKLVARVAYLKTWMTVSAWRDVCEAAGIGMVGREKENVT